MMDKILACMLVLFVASPLMGGEVRGLGAEDSASTELSSPVGAVVTGVQTIDVRAFGAKGDGVTDDRAAIQSAIDHAPSSGAIIYFPPGVYLLKSFHPSNLNSGILRMKSNITFAGTGAGSEIRLHAGWYAGKEFNIFSNYDNHDPNRFGIYNNIVFRDLLINANGASNTYVGASGPRVVIQFGDTSNARVERVTFTGINVSNVIGIGRSGRSSTGFWVYGCTFIDPTSGDTKNPDHSTIYSVATNTFISGNKFLNSTNHGKTISTAAEIHASHSTFTGNTVESYRQALYMASQENKLVDNIVVDNNKARDMNAYFANFWGDNDSNVVRRVKIANNTVEFNPSRTGFDGTAQFIGTTSRGLFSEVSITGNVVKTTSGILKNKRAIGTYTTIADWMIYGNRFSGWDGGAVHIIHVHSGKTATRVKISQNEFVECGNVGTYKIPVYVNLDNTVDITVDHNKFYSSTPTQYLVYVAGESSAANYYIGNNAAANYTPTAQDVYIGGPPPLGFPGGVTPTKVRGNWTIRRVGVNVPRLVAGKSDKLSARINLSEYAKNKAIVTLSPNTDMGDYEMSDMQLSDNNTLTMIVRNRTDNTLNSRSFKADLRIVYP